MSEYIITIKQLATVIEKCHGVPMQDGEGHPIVNPLEIDRNETIELPEIVRCRDCKHWQPWMKGAKPECWAYGEPIETEPDGFCAWGERRGE